MKLSTSLKNNSDKLITIQTRQNRSLLFLGILHKSSKLTYKFETPWSKWLIVCTNVSVKVISLCSLYIITVSDATVVRPPIVVCKYHHYSEKFDLYWVLAVSGSHLMIV